MAGKLATSVGGALASADQKPKPSKTVVPPSHGTGKPGRSVGKGGKIATGKSGKI